MAQHLPVHYHDIHEGLPWYSTVAFVLLDSIFCLPYIKFKPKMNNQPGCN